MITKGGCRYLIPARIKCIKQLRLLARADIKWHKGELKNPVSEETITRTRNRVRVERELAKILQDDSAKARADAEQLQSEEKCLRAAGDELEIEVMSRERQVLVLEMDVDDTERLHATFLRQSADIEDVIDRYLTQITGLQIKKQG